MKPRVVKTPVIIFLFFLIKTRVDKKKRIEFQF